jgi:hypothetical protein
LFLSKLDTLFAKFEPFEGHKKFLKHLKNYAIGIFQGHNDWNGPDMDEGVDFGLSNIKIIEQSFDQFDVLDDKKNIHQQVYELLYGMCSETHNNAEQLPFQSYIMKRINDLVKLCARESHNDIGRQLKRITDQVDRRCKQFSANCEALALHYENTLMSIVQQKIKVLQEIDASLAMANNI